MRRFLPSLLVLLALVGLACGTDEPGVGEQRAAQARLAALDAGLDDDVIVQASLILDGEGYDCPRDEEEEDAIVACERTDALVEPPGLFTTTAIEDLTDSLSARTDGYEFRVETTPIAGVEARCLVTELRKGRERPELGSSGTSCVSPEGALLRVVQGEQELEATDYTTEVPDNTFERPDRHNEEGTNR